MSKHVETYINSISDVLVSGITPLYIDTELFQSGSKVSIVRQIQRLPLKRARRANGSAERAIRDFLRRGCSKRLAGTLKRNGRFER